MLLDQLVSATRLLLEFTRRYLNLGGGKQQQGTKMIVRLRSLGTISISQKLNNVVEVLKYELPHSRALRQHAVAVRATASTICSN